MYGRTTCNQDTAIAILKLPLVTVTYCFFLRFSYFVSFSASILSKYLPVKGACRLFIFQSKNIS